MSCTRARAVFDEKKLEIREEVDAKKEAIGPGQVWDLLSSAATVHVASGQKTLSLKPDAANKEELIKRATGRTGNLRAPALRIGDDLYIGYNQAMYEGLILPA